MTFYYRRLFEILYYHRLFYKQLVPGKIPSIMSTESPISLQAVLLRSRNDRVNKPVDGRTGRQQANAATGLWFRLKQILQLTLFIDTYFKSARLVL